VRLNAYVLAGDPAWIPQSLASYYPYVERIIVSYDSTGRSWSGAPLSVAESLQRIADADPEGKVRLLPGEHTMTGDSVMATETAQRQQALDAASEGADWVIQLDTDEIVPSMPALLRQRDLAADHGAQAVEYPARMFYSRTKDGAFLEHCGRFWTTQAAFPGPVLVSAGTRLSLSRQAASAPLHRVDVAPWNTDPAHGLGTRVHAVVPARDAIVHMSWVRSDAQMREKSVVSGHASARDWSKDIGQWRSRARHPRWTTLGAPFTRDTNGRFRLAHLPEYAMVSL
jgi:hypothetical protein